MSNAILRPRGVGQYTNSTQWRLHVTTVSPNLWSCINEADQDGDANYIYADVPGVFTVAVSDSVYAYHSSSFVRPTRVTGVTVVATVRTVGSSDTRFKFRLRYLGVDYDSEIFTVNSSGYTEVYNQYQQVPNGDAWNSTRLNDVEIGLVYLDGIELRCTKMEVQVHTELYPHYSLFPYADDTVQEWRVQPSSIAAYESLVCFNGDLTYIHSNTLWNALKNYSLGDLRGCWGVDVNNVYAVGLGGVVLYWNGTVWTQQDTNTSTDLYSVYGIAANDIYVVGDSGTVLHWDGLTWLPIIVGTTEHLRAVWGSSTNDIYVAGAAGTIVYWDGAVWTIITPAPTVRMLNGIWGSATNDIVFVGDSGTIIRWNGAVWTTEISGVFIDLNGVYGFATNDIYAVGDGGLTIHWDGANWLPGVALGAGENLYCCWGNGTNNVLVAGEAGRMWHWDGAAWEALIPNTTEDLHGIWGNFNPDADALVTTIAIQADGKVIIGGIFTTISGVIRNYIARLNPDGTVDATFNPDADALVYTIAIQADGKVIIGGFFTTISGSARNCIARLNTDGSVDATFDPDANANINTIAIQTDGKVIIGGFFTTIGGVTRNYIARLNTDGTVDATFNPDADGGVYATVVQTDGKIIIGGGFTTIGGVTRNYIARLNTDGSVDATFDPDADNEVAIIKIQPNGKIIIGGSFTTIGATSGSAKNFIARLNTNGTVDATFDPNANALVTTIAIQTDGKIIIGGDFTTIGGVTRNYIARLNTDGTVDATFNPDADAFVATIAIQADGKVIIGGIFTTISGVTRNCIARLTYGGLLDPGTSGHYAAKLTTTSSGSGLVANDWFSCLELGATPSVNDAAGSYLCGVNFVAGSTSGSATFRAINIGNNWTDGIYSLAGSNTLSRTNTIFTAVTPVLTVANLDVDDHQPAVHAKIAEVYAGKYAVVLENTAQANATTGTMHHIGFSAARINQRIVNKLLCRPATVTDYVLEASLLWSTPNAADIDKCIYIPVLAPHDSTLNSISVFCIPGEENTGTNGAYIEFYKQLSWQGPVKVGTTVYDDGTASAQVITLALTEVINNTEYQYFIKFRSPHVKIGGATATVLYTGWFSYSITDFGAAPGW